MTSHAELNDRIAQLQSLLAKAERLKRGASVASARTLEEKRADDRLRKSNKLRQEKALFIPKPKDPLRRQQLEVNTREWLRFYFQQLFPDPFCEHHLLMIDAIDNATIYAGDQALAAPRGEGKTTIAECTVIKNVMKGVITFAVLFAATGGDARNSLASIKEYITDSDLLAADYPEVCLPVRQVGDSPQKAHSCLVYGDDFPLASAHFQWSGEEITMPRVPGSSCTGAIIATRGLDSAVRGLKKGNLRPQLAVIDDPDTEETANSEEQAKKLAKRIERAIAGLSGQGKRMSRVMLTTIQNHRCVSAAFTDPKKKPSWKGKRLAFLTTSPDRQDLWEEYMALRQSSQQEGDEFARRAHHWFLAQQEIMEAGGSVANPRSFDGRQLADGTPLQVSAIQRYYDFVADNGLEAALSELQNAPPEETQIRESSITAARVQCQVSGYPKRVIPPGCMKLTQGIDVNKTYCHWVVRAWRPEPTGYATGFTIDYGIVEVHGTVRGSDEGLDEALAKALHTRRDDIERDPYAFENGEILDPQLTLVDSKWRKDAVFRFCDEAGIGWYPAIGYGRSSGTIAPNFRESTSTSKVMSWQAYSATRPDGGWLVHINADHYKAWEHDRWMSNPQRPGALLLFGEPGRGTHRSEQSQDQRDHLSYAHHICAEIEVEEPVRGVMKRYWKEKSRNNHWLDASYRASAAAAMCSIRLYGMPASVPFDPIEITPTVTMPDGSPFLASER